MGELLSVVESSDGKVTKMVIKFDNPDTGIATRDKFPAMKKQYPGGTIITPK